MSFGKRQPGGGAAAQTLNVGMTGAQNEVATEAAETGGFPFRSLFALLIFGGGCWAMIMIYGADLVRDHRLSGTWEPAYDLRPIEGRCERKNFVITDCKAKIASVAKPDQAPITVTFMMLFTGGGGEAMVPVRSTKDRNAVSIHYAAETKLLNRTLSLITVASLMALLAFVALCFFWRGVNTFRQ